jgi:hypothetical protein
VVFKLSSLLAGHGGKKWKGGALLLPVPEGLRESARPTAVIVIFVVTIFGQTLGLVVLGHGWLEPFVL